MTEETSVLKNRVRRLRHLHITALASFNAFEQIQEYRAPNLLGQELAHQHAQAMGNYKGFLNTAEKALNTELHLAVAKLFDSHKDALHIEKLVNYAEQNQVKLTAAQQATLDDNEASSEIAQVYEGLSREDLLQIKSDLAAAKDKIERLKTVRDKKVAHENLNEPELPYLSFSEFVELIELSEKILNLVSKRLYGDIAWFDNYEEQVITDTKALLELVSHPDITSK